MTLKETFSSYNLTNGQKTLIEELEIFLTDSSTCFILKGYAGTGKTFMMKGLTDNLVANKRSFKICAPTGRAAKVISQKTKQKAYTIHKSIYSNKDLVEYKTRDEEGTETFKFFYDIKCNEDQANTVYIIDESSMISDVYSEGEFFRFGSGFLLKDLIRYINFDNNDHHKKLVFIGDEVQLPPVNMNFSPALNYAYLKDKCNIVSKEFELTEVVRQKVDSGILFNATKIRNSVKANIFNHLDIETSYPDIHVVKHEDLLSKYLSACNYIIDEETIIIAYSNASVKEFNDLVRSHFFPGQPDISISDKIILVNNNYNKEIELLNGDYGIIKHVIEKSELRIIPLKKKSKSGEIMELNVPLIFRDVVIEFKDVNNKTHLIATKILENLLNNEQRDISSDEQKAIYIDFWIRNPKLNDIKQLLHSKSINYDKLKTIVFNLSPAEINEKILSKIKELESEYFKQPDSSDIRAISISILQAALRADPYFNALRIKYGYAVTCHKAQGGEWENAFLNCKTSMGYFNAGYFRWLYTGITRAKENLYTIDEPHFRVGSNLRPPVIENLTPRNDILILKKELLESEIPFDIPVETPFLRNIFLAVSDLIKDANIKIDSIKHTSYLEHYSFSRGDEKAVFKIHYNGQDKVTRIEKPIAGNSLSNIIGIELVRIENKKVVGLKDDVTELPSVGQFIFSEPFLNEFYVTIKSIMTAANINISNITHSNYQEMYEFKRGGLIATYKFYYNGKGIFKKTEVVPTKTTGLIDEINLLLNQLNAHTF